MTNSLACQESEEELQHRYACKVWHTFFILYNTLILYLAAVCVLPHPIDERLKKSSSTGVLANSSHTFQPCQHNYMVLTAVHTRTDLVHEGLKKSSNISMLLLSRQFFLPQQHTHTLVGIQPAYTPPPISVNTQSYRSLLYNCMLLNPDTYTHTYTYVYSLRTRRSCQQHSITQPSPYRCLLHKNLILTVVCMQPCR